MRGRGLAWLIGLLAVGAAACGSSAESAQLVWFGLIGAGLIAFVCLLVAAWRAEMADMDAIEGLGLRYREEPDDERRWEDEGGQVVRLGIGRRVPLTEIELPDGKGVLVVADSERAF